MGFFCRRVLISIAFSRATHHWKDFCERKKGACDFFSRTLGARKKRGWCFGGRRERVDADFEL
jgi:hypothetical protein